MGRKHSPREDSPRTGKPKESSYARKKRLQAQGLWPGTSAPVMPLETDQVLAGNAEPVVGAELTPPAPPSEWKRAVVSRYRRGVSTLIHLRLVEDGHPVMVLPQITAESTSFLKEGGLVLVQVGDAVNPDGELKALALKRASPDDERVVADKWATALVCSTFDPEGKNDHAMAFLENKSLVRIPRYIFEQYPGFTAGARVRVLAIGGVVGFRAMAIQPPPAS